MKFNPSGLVITVGFFGLLWFALQPGAIDSMVLAAILAVALDFAVGGLMLGGVSEWSRRRWRRLRGDLRGVEK